MGTQISWLLPAALILLVAGITLTWWARRTDRTRASLIIWGGWLLVTGAVFSFSKGIIHPYYTVALAPALGALVGIGATVMWAHRAWWPARLTMSATVLVTSIWTFVLLDRDTSWHPALRLLLLVAGLVGSCVLLTDQWIRAQGGRLLAVLTLGVVAFASIGGSAAYALSTVASPHTGAIPSAGPAGSARGGPGGGIGGAVGPNGFTRPRGVGGAFGSLPGGFPGGPGGPGAGGFPGGGPLGSGGTGGAAGGTGAFGRPGAGGAGGLLNGSTSNSALTAALEANASSYTWVAAVVGANPAAGYQLASDKPVLAIGGFNGTDPWPTLAVFEHYVSQHRVHYFIASGGAGGPGRGAMTDASSISSWVESHFTSQTIGGVTVYDLTSLVSGS
jgi:hypothetical protein